MRFPKTVRFRKVEAKIYGKSKAYPFYRVCGYVAGKRRMTSFVTYSEAKAAADKLVRELAAGLQSAALTAKQASDALVALQTLEAHYQATGKRLTLAAVVDAYTRATTKLNGHTLGEAVDGYLSTVAPVKRMDLGQAVKQFIASRQPKTVAKDGKRPQLSAGYHYNVSMWLREFARTFPGYAVCDLTKELLNAYMSNHADVAPKTRNERRAVVRLFLKWGVRQDFLVATHRLLEADGMARESAQPEDIEFYTPNELAAMLHAANGQPDYKPLLPVIVLCGLAGVRLQEAARLTWKDVFRVAGHIEISAGKSKTRSRRLVTICPALRQWLAPYRKCDGPLWTQCLDKFHSDFNALRESLDIPARRNGLRHAFVTYHFALHANENLTAAEVGNSPAMIHAHYKGLATKAEAVKWFKVKPSKSGKNVIPLPAASRKQ